MSTRNRLRFVVVGLLSTGLMSMGSALAWADESIVLDLVRHGESTANHGGHHRYGAAGSTTRREGHHAGEQRRRRDLQRNRKKHCRGIHVGRTPNSADRGTAGRRTSPHTCLYSRLRRAQRDSSRRVRGRPGNQPRGDSVLARPPLLGARLPPGAGSGRPKRQRDHLRRSLQRRRSIHLRDHGERDRDRRTTSHSPARARSRSGR